MNKRQKATLVKDLKSDFETAAKALGYPNYNAFLRARFSVSRTKAFMEKVDALEQTRRRR